MQKELITLNVKEVDCVLLTQTGDHATCGGRAAGYIDTTHKAVSTLFSENRRARSRFPAPRESE